MRAMRSGCDTYMETMYQMACSLTLKTGDLKGDPEHTINIPPKPLKSAIRLRRDARNLKRGRNLSADSRERIGRAAFLPPADSASRTHSESTSGACYTATLSPAKQMMIPLPSSAVESLLTPSASPRSRRSHPLHARSAPPPHGFSRPASARLNDKRPQSQGSVQGRRDNGGPRKADLKADMKAAGDSRGSNPPSRSYLSSDDEADNG